MNPWLLALITLVGAVWLVASAIWLERKKRD